MYGFDDSWNLVEIKRQVKEDGEQGHVFEMEDSSADSWKALKHIIF